MANFYKFYDEWITEVSPKKVWDAVSDPASWQIWWPELVQVEIIKHDAQIVGSIAELTWRSRGGYKLKHIITVTNVLHGKSINFTSLGDLDGCGSWLFYEIEGKTHMVIEWYVQTTKTWMKILNPLLRNMFVKNHNILMQNGERGFDRYLKEL